MLKIFINIVFLFCVQQSINAQQYWLTQSSPTHNNLRACFFTDSLHGWIGGDSGVILKTTNNGKTWNFQNSGVRNGILSVYFVNQRKGYALSWEIDNVPPNYYGTRILSTSDGGNSWSNYLFSDTNEFLNTITFADTLNGWMGGSGGKIFYTTNAGGQWTQGVVDSGQVLGFPVQAISFRDTQNGYASGGAFDIAGVVWKTSNGGATWRTRIVGPEPVNDLHIFDPLNIIGVGGDFEFGSSYVKTQDGGSGWNYTELGIFGIANSIAFRTNSEAWVSLGIIDSFLVSTNSGINWRLTGTPGNARLYKMIFVDDKHGWAIGNNGVILKFNSELIGISEHKEFLPESVILYQNYPNPFNPKTIINYRLSPARGETIEVKLYLYDILGKKVMSLVDKKEKAGSYHISLDATNLQSGIYYYQLVTSGQFSNSISTLTKKMVVLK